MWYILGGVLVVLAAWASQRRWRSSAESRKPSRETYVCADCGEHHCTCRKKD